MSQSLECPRCRRPAVFDGDRHGIHWCTACGTQLVIAAGPKEADVRNYLYSRRLLPLVQTSGTLKVGRR